MGDEVHGVEPGQFLLLKEVGGAALAFGEDRRVRYRRRSRGQLRLRTGLFGVRTTDQSPYGVALTIETEVARATA